MLLDELALGGRVEGDCNPCNPTWTAGGDKVIGACGGVLERTDWARHTLETINIYGGWRGGYRYNFELPGESKFGTITFDPPWRCTGAPRIHPRHATCGPQASDGGGPKDVPATKHKSSKTSSRALVKKQPLGTVLS